MSEKNKPLFLSILTLAIPMVLSMSTVMMMQFIDALLLSWYSAEAISAVVPAGMAAWLLTTPFHGTASYTSTLVAHYVGAQKRHKAFSATWQGVYFSIGAGFCVALLGFTAKPLFSWAGHPESVQVLEVEYFQILCWCGFFPIINGALSGYFSGKGRTGIVMVTHLIGFGVNVILDYLFIFGKAGFPEMGIAGAAIATVIAQVLSVVLLAALFFLSHETDAHPWFDRAFNKDLFRRLLRFGFPNGLRSGLEMLVWTLFIFFLGRIGAIELAASNIAFRINGLAFFPIIGLSQAIGILVGQSQGRRDSRQASRTAMTGFLMAECWMIFMSAIFILFPSQLFDLFKGNSGVAEFAHITSVGVVLLRFVALYSLLDAANFVFISSLQAAGDTKWTLVVAVIAHVVFLGGLALIDYINPNLWMEWSLATIFAWGIALVWFFRFKSGYWKSIHVIEESFDEENSGEG